MAAIKPLDQVSSKWRRVASGASAEYEQGVTNPRKSWSAATLAAESAYKTGIQNSITRGAFASGVRSAGDTKWQTNAIQKGPMRYSQGIDLSQDNYQTGFEPYHRAISSLNLPARGAKGDPANINRVAVIAKTLHDLKLQRSK